MHFARDRNCKPLYLSTVLLRDGCILYAALGMSNVIHFVLFERSWGGNAPLDFPPMSTVGLEFLVSSGTNCEMTHAISVVLVSRMVFNLREAGTEVYESTEDWRKREWSLKTIQFDAPSSDSHDEDYSGA